MGSTRQREQESFRHKSKYMPPILFRYLRIFIMFPMGSMTARESVRYKVSTPHLARDHDSGHDSSKSSGNPHHVLK